MSGAPALHSRYNPQGEAEKYLNALELGAETEYFILIEPGLGYLIPLLKKKRPAAKIIALHIDGAFRPAAGEDPAVPAWFPGGPVSLQRFLEENIPDLEAPLVRIVEWRPSLRVYGEAYLRVLSETAEFIKRIDANARTARGFGGRWVNNFFKNLGFLRSLLKPEPFDGPLVITGSGPSLEDLIPLMGELKKSGPLFVLAASSSVKALGRGGIVPDLVVSADGGGWALRHLYECFRLPHAPPVAANLSAALPSQCSRLPVMVLDDGSLWQRTVLRGLGIPSLTIPQRGTVTAAAMDLALAICRGDICIAGTDLALRDIRTHVRPYGFDPVFWDKASRFTPLYAQMFSRAGETRRGGSHRIYASWFSRQAASWPDRVFSLGNNNPEAFLTLQPWSPEKRDAQYGTRQRVKGYMQLSGSPKEGYSTEKNPKGRRGRREEGGRPGRHAGACCEKTGSISPATRVLGAPKKAAVRERGRRGVEEGGRPDRHAGACCEKTGGIAGTYFGEPVPAPGGVSAAAGAEILIRALFIPGPAAVLTGELAPLLFPGRRSVPPDELAELIRSIGENYG
jgi:hypothetical protein